MSLLLSFEKSGLNANLVDQEDDPHCDEKVGQEVNNLGPGDWDISDIDCPIS